MDLAANWRWEDTNWRCQITDIDGAVPQGIRRQITGQGPDGLAPESSQWNAAKRVGDILLFKLERPPPFDAGGPNPIDGVNASVSSLTSIAGHLNLVYWVRYTDTLSHREKHQWTIHELAPMLRSMVETLDRDAERMAREYFTETFAGGESDPSKWPRQKTQVFISYRGHTHLVAKQLFEGLGELEDQSLILPRLDQVDMQAGNWLNQIMEMISKCEAFVPVLSNDYLNGPIARPELDLAMREHFAESNKRIVPVLIEGEPGNYTNHFIGGFHMVRAQGESPIT